MASGRCRAVRYGEPVRERRGRACKLAGLYDARLGGGSTTGNEIDMFRGSWTAVFERRFPIPSWRCAWSLYGLPHTRHTRLVWTVEFGLTKPF
jgi:hypothetical protein